MKQKENTYTIQEHVRKIHEFWKMQGISRKSKGNTRNHRIFQQIRNMEEFPRVFFSDNLENNTNSGTFQGNQEISSKFRTVAPGLHFEKRESSHRGEFQNKSLLIKPHGAGERSMRAGSKNMRVKKKSRGKEKRHKGRENKHEGIKRRLHGRG